MLPRITRNRGSRRKYSSALNSFHIASQPAQGYEELMVEPFPGSSAWSRSQAATLPRGAVALDGWMRLKGGGGGSDITPAAQARSPTGAPGSNRPTGDCFPPSFPPSSPPPGGTRSFPGVCRGGRQVAASRFWRARGRRGERVCRLSLGRVINKIRLEGRSRA